MVSDRPFDRQGSTQSWQPVLKSGDVCDPEERTSLPSWSRPRALSSIDVTPPGAVPSRDDAQAPVNHCRSCLSHSVLAGPRGADTITRNKPGRARWHSVTEGHGTGAALRGYKLLLLEFNNSNSLVPHRGSLQRRCHSGITPWITQIWLIDI